MTRPVVGVLLVALTVRWWTLLSAVAAGTSESYDATTYYTAAAALLDGRVPYTSEFILVHPPLVVLALVPFALLGALTSAPVGYVAACLAFAAMGAAAAAGVTWLALDWGATRSAAVAGGLVAALGSTAVTSQSLVRLEPLGDLLLVALLLLLGTRARVDRGRLVAAGVVVGLLVNVKLWWFAAVVVLLVLLWRRTSSWRAPLLVAGSGAATAVLLDLPFLLASRGGMLHAVVTTQRGRAPVQGTPLGEFERLPVLARLGQATGVTRAAERFAEPATVFTSGTVHAVVVLVCLAVALTAVLALRHPLGRLAAPLLLAHVVVLLAVPVYFPFYGDLLVVPAALTLAAAATVLAGRLRVHGLAVAWVSVAVLPLLLAAAASGPLLVGGPPVDDRAAVLGAVGDRGCLVADSPRTLVQLDLVERSLRPGCRNLVDVQGVGHGAGPDPLARVSRGTANRAWREAMSGYLGSADVLVLGDPTIRYLLGPDRVAALLDGRPTVTSGQLSVVGRAAAR